MIAFRWALFLVVMVIVGCSHPVRQSQYFPSELSDRSESSYLEALGQPSLYEMWQANEEESHIRLIIFNRHDNPLVYWIRIDGEGTEHFVVQQASPRTPWTQERNIQISLDIRFTGAPMFASGVLSQFRTYYETFWEEPIITDSHSSSGGLYILEVLDRGQYHLVMRSPLTPLDKRLIAAKSDDKQFVAKIQDMAARDWLFIEFVECIQNEALIIWSDWPWYHHFYSIGSRDHNEWWVIDDSGEVSGRNESRLGTNADSD